MPSPGSEMDRLALRHSWTVRGQTGRSNKAVDAFTGYLDALFAQASDRHQHLIAAARTRSRNNIAADLADVYPKQPQVAARAHRRLANGLYVGTNLSNASKVQLARQAARAAGLFYGTDALLELAE